MATNPSWASVLRVREFRLLWTGQAISLVGDQFYLIALPWLVLQLTGSTLQMGTVLALVAIPRAVFMLIGGALSDRLSPRTVMLTSNLLRMALVASLAALVLFGLVEHWMLYLFAPMFGLVDAFFYPAESAIVPQLVGKEDLHAANAINQGMAQLALFAGAALAGTVIALFGGDVAGSGALRGIGAAFLIDALTFLASAITLWMVRVRASSSVASPPRESVLSSIRAGIQYMFRDPHLRLALLIVAAINLLLSGPVSVGMPAIAALRLPEGAAAFGAMMSAYGGGSLLGIVLAGALPKPQPERLGGTLMAVIAVLGLGLAGLGIVTTTALAVVVSLVMGASNGYVFMVFITWLQCRTPPHVLGRVMSLVMFAAVGLNPVSTVLAAALIQWSPELTFGAAGGLVVAVALLAAMQPEVKSMGLEY